MKSQSAIVELNASSEDMGVCQLLACLLTSRPAFWVDNGAARQAVGLKGAGKTQTSEEELNQGLAMSQIFVTARLKYRGGLGSP